MLVEIAIGDAYGAGFEFTSPDFIRKYNNLKYTTHQSVLSLAVDQFRLDPTVIHPRQKHGRYTDDTQMSIAIAQVIVEQKPWTKEVLAESFVNAFKRDPRTGYARGFYNFLCDIQSGEEFLQNIRPHSDKSGAAMRAAPIGVFSTPEEVIEKCSLQASLTHDTPNGIASGNAAALMAHYFIYDKGPKKQLGAFIRDLIPGKWDQEWKGSTSAKGIDCVCGAITAIQQSDTLSAVLKKCIDFGGDVDTVAAIAMGPASCCRELEQDIPENLIDGLENGPYGRDYIIGLDQKLMDLASRIKARKQSV